MDSSLAALAPLLTASPAAVATRLRANGVPGVALLESALDIDELGGFSFVAARPLLVAVAEPGEDLRIVSRSDDLREPLVDVWPGDPLRAAADLIAAARPEGWAPSPPFPFAGGALVTLSYDLARRYETIPSGAVADTRCPDLHLAIYGRVLAFDHTRGSIELLGSGPGINAEDVAFCLGGGESPTVSPQASIPVEPPQLPCTFDAVQYRHAVDDARELIRQGALFEVNLSRRYTARDIDPHATYSAMRTLAPAPFMADLELGDGRRLLSSSPERFLSLSADGHVSSWPIKGTRPRDPDPEQDAQQRDLLLESPKEQAELAMIVDLVRSDLGRVARPGSVRVASARRLQSWPTVHHTVAVVEAELDDGYDWADLVRGAFPPGSVTGAPKIRAMEVIDDLEPVRRGPYCGAFGYVGFDGAADLAVAIRIVHCDGERAHVHAGGAVLLKSDAADEERETLAKARALLRATHAGRAAVQAVPRG